MYLYLMLEHAKVLLYNSAPFDIIGRDKEKGLLQSFLSIHINNKTSGSLYISGPPGTGKSATVDHFLYHEKVSL